MIIYHQNNIAAFKGNHVFYWPAQPVIMAHRVSATTAAAAGRIWNLIGPSGLIGHGGGLIQ